MTAKTLISAAYQLGFVLGLGLAVYGISLWSRPLAFVICGLFIAAVSFLVGYRDLRSGRRN
jgi:uncharacterized membrane protein YccC